MQIKNEKRRLAAIMFTDMVGYTVMMQENEALAIKLRTKHREVLQSNIAKHDGEILQYYGDGTLVIFNSAIEAVDCAREIQQELMEEPKIPLRIGIHAGDIVYDDEGIYGDGVNVASRIESLSVPGAVLFSEKIFDEVKNHPALPAQYLGAFGLKNVKWPVGVYALDTVGLAIPNPDHIEGRSVNIFKSVAVLPFVNMSADEENEYFSDGITEELINALAKVEGLMVTSRTSSFAFKGKNEDIRKIGEQLGVGAILEGSVRKAGNKIRVTAQLIKVSTGYHFWSETFDGELENIFDLQDKISLQIAEKFRKNGDKKKTGQHLVKIPTDNPEAYNQYLKGLFYWNKWNPDSVKKATVYYEKAVNLEPTFVHPYCGLSSCYVFLGATGQLSPQSSYEKAKQFAEKAVSLDPNDEGAHLTRGVVQLLYEWDIDAAEQSFNTAISLNPGEAEIHHYYSLLLLTKGQIEEAMEEITLALRLDPLSLPINLHLSNGYLSAGKYAEALAQLDKTLELEPNFRAAVETKGWVYLTMEDFDSAIAWFEKFQKMTNHPLKGVASLGCAYGLAGKQKEAEVCLKKLKLRAEQEKEVVLDADFATVHAGLGNYDEAWSYLESALKQRLMGIFLKTNPFWERMREHPKYVDLLERFGLT